MNRLSPMAFVKFVNDNRDNPEMFENIEELLPGPTDNFGSPVNLKEQLDYIRANREYAFLSDLPAKTIMNDFLPVGLMHWYQQLHPYS